jgi:hypothetical protein
LAAVVGFIPGGVVPRSVEYLATAVVSERGIRCRVPASKGAFGIIVHLFALKIENFLKLTATLYQSANNVISPTLTFV